MSVCKNCHAFTVFGEKCWYFWENKSACSQFKEHAAAEASFISLEQVEQNLQKS